MYDPKSKSKDPDATDEQALFEDVPDTQPSPASDGSVVVLEDDGEYD
jgi:hypothetical protein